DPNDAEDAFQAAFLVLVRKARSIGKVELLGNWLHGVAHRTALEARRRATRRRSREKQVQDMSQIPLVNGEDPTESLDLPDSGPQRLPDKYRAPVVLCELEGRSRRDVARQLGLAEGTLSSRLATARKLLARRLGRDGLDAAPAVILPPS